MNFQISLIDIPGLDAVKIIYISGEVTQVHLDEFKSACSPLLLTKNVDTFLFHVRDLEHIDSKMIGYLSGVYGDLYEQEKRMFLVEANEHLFDILELVGFTKMVKHYGSLQELLDLLQKEERKI